MSIKLSDIDHARFGVVTAKASTDTAGGIDEVFRACEAQGVELLILRVSSGALAAVQEAERRGGLLMDSLLYFEKNLALACVSTLPPMQTRIATPDDASRLARLAAEIFRGYHSHYHADSRLPGRRSDEVYSSWAENACLHTSVADAVLLIERSDEIIGFCALKITGNRSFDCCLVGVSGRARNEGVFGRLLQAAERWGRARELEIMEYSTQVTNVAAQRGLCRAGFLPVRSCYTLHKWFM
jgi:ribosomal protein S18 acetylase RimI-like enzyme